MHTLTILLDQEPRTQYQAPSAKEPYAQSPKRLRSKGSFLIIL